MKEAPYGNKLEVGSYSETSIVSIFYFIALPTVNRKAFTYLDAFKVKALTEGMCFDRRRGALEKSGQKLRSFWNNGMMV